MTVGRIYLVGAGPGDPDLITVKGERLLRAADVIVYDWLPSRLLLYRARPDCELISVGFRGKPGCLSEPEIARLMEEHALAGKQVVRLVAGDPFLFCRASEELVALKAASISFEVVAGVSSVSAAPAACGIPLTYRGLSPSVGLFIFGRGQQRAVAWDQVAFSMRTLVFLRGMPFLTTIVEKLIKAGRSPQTPVALVQSGTLPEQLLVKGSLADIVARAAEIDEHAPTLIIVGEVVNLHTDLNGDSEKKPLAMKCVLVTRAKEQASELSALLLAKGAWPLELPVVEVAALAQTTVLDQAMAAIDAYDWLILTSVNAVKFFREYLIRSQHDLRLLSGLKIIAVGAKTAQKIKEWGLQVALVPQEFRAEGIIAELRQQDIRGQRFLLPRALNAREILPQTIAELGGEVVVAPLYETVAAQQSAAPLITSLRNGEVDVITFTSGSTIKYFLELIGNELDLLTGVRIAVIGPVTAQAAEQAGIKVNITPKMATIEGLVDALENDYR